MGKPKLTLYVDIVSPFAYLAYYTTRHSPLFRDVEITYIPIFLGGLMKSCDNRPPLSIRNKGPYIIASRVRWSTLFKIPMSPTVPPGFPISTIQVQRALCALQTSDASKIPLALDALYEALWVNNLSSVGKAEGFTPILREVLGEELTGKMVAGMGGEEAKARLSGNTEKALNDGAFGLPWWGCEDSEGRREGFWGFDCLGLVVDFLGVERKEGGEGLRSML